MEEQQFLEAVQGLSADNRETLDKWINRQWQLGYNKGREEAKDLKLSWVVDVETENTGGGCMVDLIKLDNGLTVAVSDEFVGLYRDADDIWEGGNDLEGFWMTPHIKCPVATDQEIKTLANDALDAACNVIQEKLGQTDGGLAGIFFSDDDVAGKLADYIRAELERKGIKRK
jgi:hypothetical protein